MCVEFGQTSVNIQTLIFPKTVIVGSISRFYLLTGNRKKSKLFQT